MTLTAHLATLRARFRAELFRLGARAWQGGCADALREGSLLAVSYRSEETPLVTEETVERLRALPDGAGPVAAWSAIVQ